MDMGLTGRWALVCAASKGLGLGCAKALVAEGVNVVINARGEAFRLRTGHYPDHLEQLVERGLLEQGDLHRPYERSFAYMRNGERYTLVRPYY